MSEYHEPYELLPDDARDLHRAVKSLMEELEAVDWYNLSHHRDEEIEHACMLLEWLRRRSPKWDENLRNYLFTEAPITEVEESLEKGGGPDAPADLGLRNLKSRGAERPS
jgi:uncharacterized protein